MGLGRRWRQHRPMPSTIPRQQQQQRRPWQQPPMQKPLHTPPAAYPSRGKGRLYDNGSNVCYNQQGGTPPPDAAQSEVHTCTRCGRLGHKVGECNAPRFFEGHCICCGQYGHMVRYCGVARAREQNSTPSRPMRTLLSPVTPSMKPSGTTARARIPTGGNDMQ